MWFEYNLRVRPPHDLARVADYGRTGGAGVLAATAAAVVGRRLPESRDCADVRRARGMARTGGERVSFPRHQRVAHEVRVRCLRPESRALLRGLDSAARAVHVAGVRAGRVDSGG